MIEEPTVLDYLKAKLAFWRHSDLRLPEEELQDAAGSMPSAPQPENPPVDSGSLHPLSFSPSRARQPEHPHAVSVGEQVIEEEAVVEEAWVAEGERVFPWRTALALIFALVGQMYLNPPGQHALQGAIVYLLAAAVLVWGVVRGEFHLGSPPAVTAQEGLPVRWEAFIAGIPLVATTFIGFGGGKFTLVSITAWLITLGIFIWAFWSPAEVPWLQRAWAFIRRGRWQVRITPWMLLVFAVALVVIFFRVYRLAQVPPEMISDHAEKLLDVSDVLNGQASVFFPRNTGREFIQFYLTAAIATLLHTGLTFISLKIGTTLLGLLTLPYIYLLGREIANKRVALLAVLLAGIAYWPNVITRIALRFTLYPAFVAPLFYYLIRGLRRSSRNDFIFAGIALGLGLNGYTSYRIVPLVVLAAFLIYLLHRRARDERAQALVGLAAVILVGLVIALPLLRYTIDNPEAVLGRSLTRMTGEESALPGPVLGIFFGNLWNALTMFFWSDGTTWVHSVVLRPALDTVSAALFFTGFVLVLARYIRRRSWVDLFLMVSIPLLMLPSVLSLAFPIENPSLNRTGGAIIPVFLIAAVGLDEILTSLRGHLPRRLGSLAAGSVALVLVAWSASQNYDLVFRQYYQEFRQNSWNTSEMGRVIRGFAVSVGSADNAWVIPYPYWVDTRLVGINAGYPTKDYALNADQVPATKDIPGAKLFIVDPVDTKSAAVLRSIYPQGTLSTYASAVPGKDFLLFQVPPG